LDPSVVYMKHEDYLTYFKRAKPVYYTLLYCHCEVTVGAEGHNTAFSSLNRNINGDFLESNVAFNNSTFATVPYVTYVNKMLKITPLFSVCTIIIT